MLSSPFSLAQPGRRGARRKAIACAKWSVELGGPSWPVSKFNEAERGQKSATPDIPPRWKKKVGGVLSDISFWVHACSTLKRRFSFQVHYTATVPVRSLKRRKKSIIRGSQWRVIGYRQWSPLLASVITLSLLSLPALCLSTLWTKKSRTEKLPRNTCVVSPGCNIEFLPRYFCF
jgi:hypothetical protein